MNRDTRYPVITASLFLRSQYDPTSRAGGDLAIGFLRVAKTAGFRNRRKNRGIAESLEPYYAHDLLLSDVRYRIGPFVDSTAAVQRMTGSKANNG
jgi:hypothetical protein